MSELFTALTQAFGFNLATIATIATIGAATALVWAVVGIYLGKKFTQLSA